MMPFAILNSRRFACPAQKVARGSRIHSAKLQPAVKAIFAIIPLFTWACGQCVTYGVPVPPPPTQS